MRAITIAGASLTVGYLIYTYVIIRVVLLLAVAVYWWQQ